jgi:capsular polysaccharide transport system permease protein
LSNAEVSDADPQAGPASSEAAAKALVSADGREHLDALSAIALADNRDLAVRDLAEDAQADVLATMAGGGPIVADIELRPLPIRPILRPAATHAVAPAVGFWGRYGLFISVVVAPMAIGALFLGFVATPRYASSTEFIVRAAPPPTMGPAASSQQLFAQSSSTQPGSSGQSSASGQSSTSGQSSFMQQSSMPQEMMAQLTQQQGSTKIAQDESYAVNAYLTSRDLVDRLARNDDLRGILSRPEGDFIFRFPTFWLPDNSEFLYQRFQWMVDAKIDAATNVSTIEANAFTPNDAQALTKAMLGYAEDLVNQINQRGYENELATDNHLVAGARKNVEAIEAALMAYRNSSGSLDPNLVAQAKLKVVEGLSIQLAQIQATIAQMHAITPTSPSLESLRAQADSYAKEIEKRKGQIAGSTASESTKLETYEELTLQRDLAAKTLAFAVAQRDLAMQDANRQHLFVQVIAEPNLSSDYARYPRITLDLAVLLAICLVTFKILEVVMESVAENRRLRGETGHSLVGA